MNQQPTSDSILAARQLTFPIESLRILRTNLYIPRAMYRRTSLVEAVDEKDLQVFKPEFRDRIRMSLTPPTDPVTAERPLGPRSVPVIGGPALGADQIEALMDAEAGRLESLVRGRLSESASLVQEYIPLNFRKEGLRGERQLSRMEEATSWEQIRRTSKSMSTTSEGRTRMTESFFYGPGAVTKSEISLSRVIWDPQPFLLVVPAESVPALLSTCSTALQMRGYLAKVDGPNIQLQPRRWASLDIGGAFLEVRASLPLMDLGSWPTLDGLKEAVQMLGSLALPGREAVEEVLEVLEQILEFGEELVWWIPSLPAQD